MSRVLVIDDDPGVRSAVERTLRRGGHVVDTAESGERGLEIAAAGRFDVIVTDLNMPGLSGLDVLREVRQRRIDTTLIVMTAFGTIATAVEAMKLGAADYVQKPFVGDELLMRVRAAAEGRLLARQVRLLQHLVSPPSGISALLGASEAMARLRGLVQRAAAAPGTVLITGETGTGKELVARAIHAESARADNAFVPVNCAALTESLLESELFGHARGSFTGATASRNGLIEHAHRGTLLLDEIGTIPKALQAKLLRVLESGEIRRVGENETRKVDTRFVAATNVDLIAAVAKADFREDLYYRLNVHHIHIPPLRDRADDVPGLLDHFLKRYGGPAGVLEISDEARRMLLAYDYPGNVRQLEHVIQRAVAVAHGSVIDEADLPAEIVRPARAAEADEASMAAARERGERDSLVAALERHRGNLSDAARELQISRTTLWRRLRKYGLADDADGRA